MNKETFKKNIGILVALTIAAAIICVVTYLLAYTGNMEPKEMSFWVTASVCLLPLRKLTQIVVLWGIEYFASINSTFRKKLKEKVVTQSIDPDVDDFLNPGVTFGLNAAIWVVWGFVVIVLNVIDALKVFYAKKMFLIFESFSKFAGTTWNKTMFLIWFAMSIAIIVWALILLWQWYKNINAKHEKKGLPYNLERNFMAFVIIFFIRKIFNYFYYDFTLHMVFIDLAVTLLALAVIAIIHSKVSKKSEKKEVVANEPNDDVVDDDDVSNAFK